MAYIPSIHPQHTAPYNMFKRAPCKLTYVQVLLRVAYRYTDIMNVIKDMLLIVDMDYYFI